MKNIYLINMFYSNITGINKKADTLKKLKLLNIINVNILLRIG